MREEDYRTVLQMDRRFPAYSKDQALASLKVYLASTVIPFSNKIVRFRADKSRRAVNTLVKNNIEFPRLQYTAADR